MQNKFKVTVEHGLQYNLLQDIQIFFATTSQYCAQHILACDTFGGTIG
jgi:hypothetical protein